MHIAYIVKVGRTNFCVNCHQTLVSLFRPLLRVLAEILAFRDLERSLPVFTVHGNHKVLEIVQRVHIGWCVLLGQLFTNFTFQVKVLI